MNKIILVVTIQRSYLITNFFHKNCLLKVIASTTVIYLNYIEFQGLHIVQND